MTVMKRARRTAFLLSCLGVLVAGCGGSGDGGPAASPVPYEHDFGVGAGTWVGDSADYGVDTAPLDAKVEIRALPAPYTGTGLFLGGTNRSDDLFLYARTAVGGLDPGRFYRVSLEVEFLTDAPRDCVGVGGAPGESVWIVAGAAAEEPVTVFDGTDYRVDMDRGNQATGGSEAVALGDIAGTHTDCGSRSWETKELATSLPSPLSLRPDASGTVWLLVGMDSGFEAASAIYLRRVTATFTPMPLSG